MNNKGKIKLDIISFICFLMIVLSMVLVGGYYFLDRVDSCTSNPIQYFNDNMKDKYEIDGVSGTLSLMVDNKAVYHFIVDHGNLTALDLETSTSDSSMDINFGNITSLNNSKIK